MIINVKNYVGGEFIESPSEHHVEVTTPHTGEIIARVPLSTKLEVDQAVQAADTAFGDWSSKTVKARVQIMMRFHYLISTVYANELRDIIVKEHGKTKSEAAAEIAKGLETFEYAISMPQLACGSWLEVSRGVMCRDERCPLGVVVSIVPFNFPFMVPFWTVGHAIALGNTIVIKPSEKVPLTLTRVMDIFAEAGVPKGVINVVHGTAETVNALCDHSSVKAVTFVGTSLVASLLQKRCHAQGKRILALGGAKNHLIAAPDCNKEMTSQDIVNSFSGCSGQRCMAASVLLTIGERPDLVQLIIDKASKLVPGVESGQMGPVIDQRSLDKMLHYIDKSVSEFGATLLLDGRSWVKHDGKGFWLGPTVLLCSNRADPSLHDEIFGPILSIFVCKNGQEAIEIENASPYGNAACIYTESGKTADWFTKRMSAGMLGVNIGVPVPREPFSFGGINASKFGDCDITGDAGIVSSIDPFLFPRCDRSFLHIARKSPLNGHPRKNRRG